MLYFVIGLVTCFALILIGLGMAASVNVWTKDKADLFDRLFILFVFACASGMITADIYLILGEISKLIGN